MQLLRSMDTCCRFERIISGGLRSSGARTIFKNYWQSEGPRGLGTIRAEAVYLGQTGQYPYGVVASILSDLVSSQSKKASLVPPDGLTLVSDAYSSYRRGSRFRVEDQEFARFLQTLHPTLPAALFRQGLEIAVDRLLADNERDGAPAYISHVRTEKGTAIFHRRQDDILFEPLPLVHEVDPDWAAQIVAHHQALIISRQKMVAGKSLLPKA
jgi:hypothetical protein